jgi:hypothetical protein
MIQTSLIGLETPVFLPQTADAANNGTNSTTIAQNSDAAINGTNASSLAVPVGTSLIDTSETRFKKQSKKTTLTIVQDFPKKLTELSAPSINLVQGKMTDVQFMPEGSRTTLTIVQDFPKKHP